METTRDCWLKQSLGYMVPRKQRSYLDMSCLGEPGHELYSGYNEKITEMLAMKCPFGFQNWIPLSPYCYNLVTPTFTQISTTQVCKKLNGQLVLIDSKDVNDAYVKQMVARKISKHDAVRMGWSYGNVINEKFVVSLN